MAADVAAVIDKLELDRFDLLAHSTGGPFAIDYAASNPERVSNLILFCTAASGEKLYVSDARFVVAEAIRKLSWDIYVELLGAQPELAQRIFCGSAFIFSRTDWIQRPSLAS